MSDDATTPAEETSLVPWSKPNTSTGFTAAERAEAERRSRQLIDRNRNRNETGK
jgi:hypothetical protein